MNIFNIFLTWLLKVFFKYMESITVAILFLGALAVCCAVGVSQYSVSQEVKNKIPIALLVNIMCVIFILPRMKSNSLNRQELITLLEKQNSSGLQVLKKHGLLIFGFMNLLFWGGWLMCGMLLILFFGDK